MQRSRGVHAHNAAMISSPLLRRMVCAFLLVVLWACSPAYNWREFRLPETGLLAMMPCKPDTLRRQVPFAHGAETAVVMSSCEASGITFVLSSADVGHPAKVSAALQTWREVSFKHWHMAPHTASSLPFPTSATLGAATLHKATGRHPGGQDMGVWMVMFAQDSRVYQAAMLARPAQAVSPDVADTFLSGLKLQ